MSVEMKTMKTEGDRTPSPSDGVSETDKGPDASTRNSETTVESVDKFVDRDRRLLAGMPSNQESQLKELKTYWKPIKKDPFDFTAWTYLLQYVDAGDDVGSAVETYRAFLSRYPYCYGYWKKFADYVKKRATVEEAEAVFDEALQAIPLSVDLWLHYINHVRATYEESGVERVREAFKRAISACGLEFRSNKLWLAYVKWETEKGTPANVMKIYDRLLQIPIMQHETFFASLKKLVEEKDPRDILRPEELATFLEAPDVGAKNENVEAESDDEPDAKDEVLTDEAMAKLTDEQVAAVRNKILENRAEMYKKLEEEVKKRQPFEDAIKRPYFHVKPLERGQLKTWHDYLTFEMKEGVVERIKVLFERCFIACALYEEFWLRYVEYLRSSNAPLDEIADVFRRVCTVHQRNKLGINLRWALFEEKRGNYSKSVEILETVEDYFGPCLPIVTRKVGLARRARKLDDVESIYVHYIELFTKRGNRAQADALSIKLSRFVDVVVGDRARAEKIIEDALEKSPENARLYTQLVDLMLVGGLGRRDDILAVFEKAEKSSMSDEAKLTFRHRKMEFLEDFADDVELSEKAFEEFAAAIAKSKSDRKRKLAADGSGGGGKVVRLSTTNGLPYAGAASNAAGSGDGSPAYAPYGYPASAPPPSSGYQHSYPSYNYGYQSSSSWGYGGGYGSYPAAGYGHY